MANKGGFGETIRRVDYLRNAHGSSQAAINLITQTLQQESLEPGDCSTLHCRLGVLYQEIGQNKKAKQHYQKALQLAEKAKNDLLVSNALRVLSFLSLKTNAKPDKSEELAIKAFQLVKNKKSSEAQELKASIYELLGNISGLKDNHKTALGHYRKGLKIAQKVNDIKRVVTISSDIGGTYIKTDQFSKAKVMLNQAERLVKEYLPALPTLHLRFAYLAFKEGNLAKAEKLCLQVLAFVQERGWKQDQAEAYEGLGYIYQAQHKNQEAAHTFRQAGDIFREINLYEQARKMQRLAQPYLSKRF